MPQALVSLSCSLQRFRWIKFKSDRFYRNSGHVRRCRRKCRVCCKKS